MLSMQELRKTDIKTLEKELEEARGNTHHSSFSLKMRQEKKSDTKQKNKKYIAQIYTVMKEINQVQVQVQIQ